MMQQTYSISQFTPAPSVRSSTNNSGSNDVKMHIDSELALVNVDDLVAKKLDIPDAIKILIIHGNDPENLAKYKSRSEALWAVVCALVRAGADDATIAGVIMNSDNGISSSVLDKPNPKKYAAKQIRDARNDIAADEGDPIAWVNKRYFAALEGGKVAYYRKEDDGVVEAMQAHAFEFELAPHSVITAEKKSIPYSRLWKYSSKRNYFPRGFVLDPSNTHDAGAYNLWKGFGIEPLPGEWKRLRQHIHEVLADGDDALAEYIIKWAAWSFQNPATPPRVALAFKGGEGCGKGIFCNGLVQIFGLHGLRVQHMLHVTGRFNSHLRHRCLLFADEVVIPDKDTAGALKGLITEPTLPIERKGVDVVDAENHLHIVMSSNSDWIVPAGSDARRFAVFAVSNKYKGNTDYFTQLSEEMSSGGLAAMLHELLQLDLRAWHPEAARPETKELTRQKLQSLGPIDSAWYDCLLTGTLPGGTLVGESGCVRLPTQVLTKFIARRNLRDDVTDNKVTDLLKILDFVKYENPRPRGYEIPALSDARQRWDMKKFPVQWDNSETSWHIAQDESWHDVDDMPFR